jgi:hypothetical protein
MVAVGVVTVVVVAAAAMAMVMAAVMVVVVVPPAPALAPTLHSTKRVQAVIEKKGRELRRDGGSGLGGHS